MPRAVFSEVGYAARAAKQKNNQQDKGAAAVSLYPLALNAQPFPLPLALGRSMRKSAAAHRRTEPSAAAVRIGYTREVGTASSTVTRVGGAWRARKMGKSCA